ncbi:GNAT family N-acetyltransferase [Salipaludibacillus neizhouensis]|uniref:GNAT family N-acetyltransferase n=1 Tax=Salipaludibacillus neizhouensis TaxID=885475 RepID=UPI001CBA656F|nr:GNAT family N-acetyltransferase [Salipaludibacillus neizhouensis]
MIMTQNEMIYIVQSQLAIDLNCVIDDLNDEKNSIIFVEAQENPGRRPFRRNSRFFEIVSMGKSIVVSATPERLSIAKKQMQDKDSDSIFALPFIRGLYLHYLPDLKRIIPISPLEIFSFELIEQDKVVKLLNGTEFKNAIIYDRNHPWQTDLAVLAKKDGEIVGVAGASKTCARLWQIGIDIFPEYRNFGLASYLVNRLTLEILERGDIPSYDVIASNIASQRVAQRSGYSPGWVSDWRCNFEGLEA